MALSESNELTKLVDIFKENELCNKQSIFANLTVEKANKEKKARVSVEIDDEASLQMQTQLQNTMMSNSHYHPCLSRGSVPFEHDGKVLDSFYGSGDFASCVQNIREVLGPQLISKIDHNCLRKNTISYPMTVIGIENFAKVLQVMGIPNGVYVSPADIFKRGTTICAMSWQEISKESNNINAPTYRSWRLCFASAFVYTILTDVFGMEQEHPGFVVYENFEDWNELNWSIGAAALTALNAKVNQITTIN